MDPKQIQIKILSAFFQTLGIHICSSGKSLNTKSVAGSFPALFGEQREQNVAAQRSHWERFAWSDKANPFAGFIYQQQELLVEPKQLNLKCLRVPYKTLPACGNIYGARSVNLAYCMFRMLSNIAVLKKGKNGDMIILAT